jgi:hypothetical protein
VIGRFLGALPVVSSGNAGAREVNDPTAGHPAKGLMPMTEQAQAVIKRGRKVVLVDVERRKGKVSELTVDEARAMAADMTTRFAALRRRWEASGDLQALLGALIFCQPQLPEWLFKGLMQNLEQQLRNPDEIRFLAVRYAHDVLGKTMDEAYDWASNAVTDPAAKGGRDTMMKSYQKIRPQVAKIDRIQPRPRAPRRRR